MLRPLEARDHDAWREIRIRSRDWLEQWEPLPEPGTRDPTIDRDAFRSRCGAWERQRQFDTAYGFGTFLLDGTLVGEVSLGSVLRGPFQSCFIGYWIDERYAGCGYTPDAVAIVLRYGRAVDTDAFVATGFEYGFTTPETVEAFARARRLERVVGPPPAYEYEHEVEHFFRNSRAVVQPEA